MRVHRTTVTAARATLISTPAGQHGAGARTEIGTRSHGKATKRALHSDNRNAAPTGLKVLRTELSVGVLVLLPALHQYYFLDVCSQKRGP